MRIFISWSGEQSRQIAEALRGWLPLVMQSLEPFLSSVDIRQGSRWGNEISSQLEGTNFGIVCLTPSNLEAPWIMFEAGALSKNAQESLIFTYLADGVGMVDIAEPLKPFQATRADKEHTKKLVTDINAALKGAALKESQLNATFDKFWPDLEEKLRDVKPDSPVAKEEDPLAQIAKGVEELLQRVRAPQALMSNLGFPTNYVVKAGHGLFAAEGVGSASGVSNLTFVPITSPQAGQPPISEPPKGSAE